MNEWIYESINQWIREMKEWMDGWMDDELNVFLKLLKEIRYQPTTWRCSSGYSALFMCKTWHNHGDHGGFTDTQTVGTVELQTPSTGPQNDYPPGKWPCQSWKTVVNPPCVDHEVWTANLSIAMATSEFTAGYIHCTTSGIGVEYEHKPIKMCRNVEQSERFAGPVTLISQSMRLMTVPPTGGVVTIVAATEAACCLPEPLPGLPNWKTMKDQYSIQIGGCFPW
jgi:hypothetical protein